MVIDVQGRLYPPEIQDVIHLHVNWEKRFKTKPDLLRCSHPKPHYVQTKSLYIHQSLSKYLCETTVSEPDSQHSRPRCIRPCRVMITNVQTSESATLTRAVCRRSWENMISLAQRFGTVITAQTYKDSLPRLRAPFHWPGPSERSPIEHRSEGCPATTTCNPKRLRTCRGQSARQIVRRRKQQILLSPYPLQRLC
jgi:hypothetical protein